jgi:hypothetical protein
MHASIALLLELGILLLLLSVLGTVARRLSLTPIPLYLLAGLVVGEGGLLPVQAAGEYIQTSAKIGLVLLLLTLGLEFSGEEFAESLKRHVPSAAVDFVLNATPGAVAGLLLGLGPAGVLALAGATQPAGAPGRGAAGASSSSWMRCCCASASACSRTAARTDASSRRCVDPTRAAAERLRQAPRASGAASSVHLRPARSRGMTVWLRCQIPRSTSRRSTAAGTSGNAHST